MVAYVLIEYVISAVMQIAILVALYPLNRLFKRALKRQHLQAYFKEARFPRYSVRILLITLVVQALMALIHGVWACIELARLYKRDKSVDQELRKFGESTMLMLADEITNYCTMVLIVVFFLLLGRNMRRLKENLEKLTKAKL